MPGTAEIVARGLHFGEGPRWRDGTLWLSDQIGRTVYTFDGDRLMPELTIVDQPSGLGWLPDGRLLVVAMHGRAVLRREADGTLVTHADLTDIAEFHTNDMLVDAFGRAWVGNFGFDLDDAMGRGTVAELAGTRLATLVRVDADGSVHEVATGLRFPNGTVMTSDGRTLVVAETLGQSLAAFRVADDGTLHDRREWAALTGRAPDGICLDADGNIWVADASRGECVLVADGGEIVDVVDTGEPCFACALGGDDGRTLYCLTAPTARPEVLRPAPLGAVRAVGVATPGAGSP